jgi:hypothetical protein
MVAGRDVAGLRSCQPAGTRSIDWHLPLKMNTTERCQQSRNSLFFSRVSSVGMPLQPLAIHLLLANDKSPTRHDREPEEQIAGHGSEIFPRLPGCSTPEISFFFRLELFHCTVSQRAR